MAHLNEIYDTIRAKVQALEQQISERDANMRATVAAYDEATAVSLQTMNELRQERDRLDKAVKMVGDELQKCNYNLMDAMQVAEQATRTAWDRAIAVVEQLPGDEWGPSRDDVLAALRAAREGGE